eukprot:scaffold301_cov243-Pinguiococcus_pyrenoidosus.AAC.172
MVLPQIDLLGHLSAPRERLSRGDEVTSIKSERRVLKPFPRLLAAMQSAEEKQTKKGTTLALRLNEANREHVSTGAWAFHTFPSRTVPHISRRKARRRTPPPVRPQRAVGRGRVVRVGTPKEAARLPRAACRLPEAFAQRGLLGLHNETSNVPLVSPQLRAPRVQAIAALVLSSALRRPAHNRRLRRLNVQGIEGGR